MNRTFDAPEPARLSNSQNQDDSALAPSRAERRRASRWTAHVPVFVYGHAGGQAPFHEEAYSAVVSDRGALLVMTAPVLVGDKLLLTNKLTQLEQQCRVVSVGPGDGLGTQIGVEFSDAAADFWRITASPRPAACTDSVDQQQKAR
jgi:PilZ domain